MIQVKFTFFKIYKESVIKKINLGLIGCGSLGRIHAACIARIPNARFLAYADINLSAARSMMREFGGEIATEKVGEVLADDRIDAVYICTQHDSHASLAIAAARHGKHVFCEKPLALTSEDCEAVADAVAETGIVFVPAFKLRYYPLVQRAREFIKCPQVMVGQMMDARWPDDAWAQDPQKGGANVHSQGCHTIDLLRYFAGSEPARIWAAGGSFTHPGHECIDQCVATIQFENGSVASWIQGDAGLAAWTSKFYFGLYADNRSVQLSNRLKLATFCDGDRVWSEQRDEEEGFHLENEMFIRTLVQGHSSELTVEDGLQATRIVLAADRAIRTGQIQTLGKSI